MIVVRRVLLMAPILFGIATLTFFVTHVLPGNPVYSIVPSDATAEQIRIMSHTYGFDRPLWDQYAHYLDGVVHLDFGKSIFTGDSVAHDFALKLPVTFELVGFAFAVALILGIPAGTLAARQRGRRSDDVVRATSIVLLSLPEFWFGLILLYTFFLKLKIAPGPIGQLAYGDPTPTKITGAAAFDSLLTANFGALKAALSHLVLPVLTMGLLLSAPIMRLTRSAVLEVLESNYILFGRSCGLSARTLWRYSTRMSLPPVVTFTGVVFTHLLGGAVLVETIFSWPGAGQYLASSVLQNDYSVVQGFVLLSGVASVVVYLIVDLLYVAIDPRVRL